MGFSLEEFANKHGLKLKTLTIDKVVSPFPRKILLPECPKCKNTVFVSDSYSTCDCGDFEITKEALSDQLEVYRSIEELSIEETNIYCTECFTIEPTVIKLKNGSYFCLECFIDFDETSECEWCNTRYAGDIGEHTYLEGCEMCDGHIGWHMSKDD